MQYNFDQIIPRHNTNSVKWEIIKKGDEYTFRQPPENPLDPDHILPLWVADMDLPCPQPVVDALVDRAKHGIFGYSMPSDDYYDAIIGWMGRRHNWAVEKDWIMTAPGVVPTLNLLIQTYTEPGDNILIQRPVYHPFFHSIKNNGRHIVNSPLAEEDGRYRIDFADLESKLATGVKMAILCSPHNPISRVWNAEELQQFGQLCRQYNALVISDEIHHDLIFSWSKFVTYGVANPDLMDNAIICTAPSKTFNVPGLKTSNVFISDHDLKTKFEKTLANHGLMGVNSFGIVALQTAYNEGEEWLEQAMAYIEANYLYMDRFIRDQLPQLSLIRPEGTYLIWCDCRQLGMNGDQLAQFLLDDAKLFLNSGAGFGEEGEGFVRFNIACSRATLEEALKRLKTAIERL